MAALVDDSVHDASHNDCRDNVDRITVLSAEPANFAEANATLVLADVAAIPGDFTISDGDVSGRKIQVAQKDDVLIDVSGIANHIAWLDTTNSIVKRVFTCSNQTLDANGSNVIAIPAHQAEIRDPA